MDNSSTIFDESKWLSFKKNLKKNVGDSAFNNWLKHLHYVSVDETIITFSVPTKFLRDWIVNNYSDKIKSEAKKHVENIDTIKFVVKPILILIFVYLCVKVLIRFLKKNKV